MRYPAIDALARSGPTQRYIDVKTFTILRTNDGDWKFFNETTITVESFVPDYRSNWNMVTKVRFPRYDAFAGFYKAPAINGTYGGLGNPPFLILDPSIEPTPLY